MTNELLLAFDITQSLLTWLNARNIRMQDLADRIDANGGKITRADLQELSDAAQKAIDRL